IYNLAARVRRRAIKQTATPPRARHFPKPKGSSPRRSAALPAKWIQFHCAACSAQTARDSDEYSDRDSSEVDRRAKRDYANPPKFDRADRARYVVARLQF